jgi:hypothetical protein
MASEFPENSGYNPDKIELTNSNMIKCKTMLLLIAIFCLLEISSRAKKMYDSSNTTSIILTP